MTIRSLTDVRASRFYQRWVDAAPQRAGQVEQLASVSLAQCDFAALLQSETANAMQLPRAMRRVRNLVMAAIIRRDLSGQADLNEVVTTISRFADFVIQTHLNALHPELVALHGQPIGEESGKPQHLIVLGMGKLGGCELNVSSDIDLIFAYNEDGETRCDTPQQRQLSNHEFFARLGKRLIADIAEVAEDGFSFRVDMALRPNGKSGPLACSFNMLEQYLMVQGREWERYAWVKARAVTGQPDDLAILDGIVRPFVYRRYLDYGAISALRDMHRQIRAEVLRQEARHPGRSNNVKLGRGGIREVEFLSQVFQLIRGGRDAELRDRSTRKTLTVLSQKNLLAPEVVERLCTAYVFLRNVEHRMQYLDDAQTHSLPSSPEDQSTIAQMMGHADLTDFYRALDEQRAFVAGQFDAIFSEKEMEKSDENSRKSAPAAVGEEDSEEHLASVLEKLEFDEPAEAARRLHGSLHAPRMNALPSTSRQHVLTLVNASLLLIAKLEGERRATLLRVLDFIEAIARRASYLALLTEFPHALGRVVRMMHASQWAAQYLTRHPLLLDELLDDNNLHSAPDWEAFATECQRQLQETAGDTERQMDVLRELHHAALLRLLAQDLEGQLTVERLADHLSALADVLVQATLNAVWQSMPNRHRPVPLFAVIAYGKLGGKELGYASDLDLIFLYDDDHQEAPVLYARLAQKFILWMTSHTPAGILFDIDVALRPDGASGLMVSPFASFERYQKQSAWIWEHQALTRARHCAGDVSIGQRFEALRVEVLRQPREEAPLKQAIVDMRRKMHEAHPNRSDLFDLKHDSGAMIDIEFMVQYLVLRYASLHAELTADIGNIALLKLCGQLGLIDADLAGRTADAYRDFRRLQHQMRLQGADRARVSATRVATRTEAVRALYAQVFDV